MTSTDQRDDIAFAPPGVTWHSVSPRLGTVRTLLCAIWLGIPLVGVLVLAIAVGGWTWILPAALALVLIWALWLVPRQVRAMSYAEREDDFLFRKGVMFRSLVVVPYGRMQYVDVSKGPLAQRFRIATLQLHTASASTDASVPGLAPEEAARLRDRLTARGEARLAGL
ncbi:membrane-flanked domain protein [Beutenbergia cavernae DSM 12333]|uniref:Membrane-flanked domain protein n=1 Tax=Beutenbergia cavernae (strain ATCC BAA-8 / DSM 12333 / CCUG 43141 / JCM 11478 / NBRC 16432 / NCIMB 13614 / HKI 0122) TaxID=471853 RepID=C5BYL0_BEUC1|nr:PH domain-containing protein [Beutenbergia cavernae]ACQ78968.1 membrane-flanked domain protein [Beutenbergia cavernae DSM 12333]